MESGKAREGTPLQGCRLKKFEIPMGRTSFGTPNPQCVKSGYFSTHTFITGTSTNTGRAAI
jgi:hypothetical protein